MGKHLRRVKLMVDQRNNDFDRTLGKSKTSDGAFNRPGSQNLKKNRPSGKRR